MVVHQEGVICEKCSPIQKCADAVKPILDPIIIDPIIFDPNNPDGPTTHQILCFICDEENLAYSVGQYFTVPVISFVNLNRYLILEASTEVFILFSSNVKYELIVLP